MLFQKNRTFFYCGGSTALFFIALDSFLPSFSTVGEGFVFFRLLVVPTARKLKGAKLPALLIISFRVAAIFFFLSFYSFSLSLTPFPQLFGKGGLSMLCLRRRRKRRQQKEEATYPLQTFPSFL
eukprot:TRINITY_DN5220_c1_g1_i1.p1 TRINITY_DN5220_c1_g1~~TRINITY_DN5220_c1_g1_i1.p1  ORF type:complete len:124 (+),score=9.28 TRINITY_DN5220_c1_g1_i1:474-845(+)